MKHKYKALEIVFEYLSDYIITNIEPEDSPTDDPNPESDKINAVREEIASCFEGLLFELEMIAQGKQLVEDKRFSHIDVAALKALWEVEIEVEEE